MTNMAVNARELYDLLLQIPDLCGTLTLENDFVLRWNLWESYYLGIFFSGDSSQISLNNGTVLQAPHSQSPITHQRPTAAAVGLDLFLM